MKTEIKADLLARAETKPELTYQQKELIVAAEKHDWTYGMTLKLSGSENSGKTIRVSEAQFKKLLRIFA